ncbi:R-spondin-3-like protein [Lates japonicus]|uniref:R-spondin-3-like protein n=1 Tax=Lates japonicus TaxID=270547 RepID=A0AAD3RIG8_LATJO|nr:R-spondin-3-like protein [Lates japonicus]
MDQEEAEKRRVALEADSVPAIVRRARPEWLACPLCSRLFLHLELDGMRQRHLSVVLSRGHYGVSCLHINTCTSRVQRGLAASGNFCTRCHPGHFVRANVKLSKWSDTKHSSARMHWCTEVGEWTEWGPCIGKGYHGPTGGEVTRTDRSCGPVSHSEPCPHVSETRRCIIKRRQSQTWQAVEVDCYGECLAPPNTSEILTDSPAHTIPSACICLLEAKSTRRLHAVMSCFLCKGASWHSRALCGQEFRGFLGGQFSFHLKTEAAAAGVTQSLEGRWVVPGDYAWYYEATQLVAVWRRTNRELEEAFAKGRKSTEC